MFSSFRAGNGYKCVKRVQSKRKQSKEYNYTIAYSFIPQRCVEHSNEKSTVVQREQRSVSEQESLA